MHYYVCSNELVVSLPLLTENKAKATDKLTERKNYMTYSKYAQHVVYKIAAMIRTI